MILFLTVELELTPEGSAAAENVARESACTIEDVVGRAMLGQMSKQVGDLVKMGILIKEVSLQ